MKISQHVIIPSGNITVEGELRERIERNFFRMQDEPFRAGKAGINECRSPGWPGDWEGRALLASVLDGESLKKKSPTIDALTGWIYSLMNDEGYRSEPGDKLNLNDINEQMHSAQNWLMRAFMEYYRVTGKTEYLETVKTILEKLYLPIKPHLKNYPRTAEDRKTAYDSAVVGHTIGRFREWRLSSDVGCLFMCFDALGQAYGLIEEEPLHGQIGGLIDDMLGEFRRMDYVGARLQTHASLTCMRGIMRVYKITGRPDLLETVKHFFSDYIRYGMTATYENINLFLGADHTEPCGIIDSYMLAMQLWEETDDVYYLGTAQRIWWNGVMRTQRKNGGFGCDWTGRDGILRPLDAFYEAYWCCSMRGAEGLGYPVRHALYTDERGYVFTLPHFFDFTAELNGATVRFRTGYPVKGVVSAEVLKGGGGSVQFRFYLPDHARNPAVRENGWFIDSKAGNGFTEFDAELDEGNVYEYTFDISLHEEDCGYLWHGEDEMTVMYGDLVLGTSSEFDGSPDISHFVPLGEGRFICDGWTFGPFYRSSFVREKADDLKVSYRVVFKKQPKNG
ncbi:MAG: glycoside hydrolase family 127 protein [Clostridia bacterium]|nr:glycoside hydrolase family 127 protein [Clostridia bacterium]